MLEVITTKTFEKDYARMVRQGKKIEKINKVIKSLQDGLKLDPKYRDHKLSGAYKGWRDCHIEPDWLLIYRISATLLILERTGTHSDLFNK